MSYLVVFTLAGEVFAFSLEYVKKAFKLTKLSPLPKSPPWIAGIWKGKEHFSPVINLKKLLRLSPEEGKEKYILLIEEEAFTYGVMVDELLEIIPIPQVVVKQSQKHLKFYSSQVVEGYIERENGYSTICWLNVSKILSLGEKQWIKKFLERSEESSGI